MRIAYFTEVFPPKIDGITNRLSMTLRELRREGHDVLVFAPERAVAKFEGYRVVRIPGLPLESYPELRVSAPDPRLVWELWRFGPDVVHAVGPTCLGGWGLLAARALALPAVASFHTDLARYLPRYGFEWVSPALWPLLRSAHGLAHWNLCPSSFTRRELEAKGIEINGLWPGGVDLERFSPERASAGMRERLSGGAPEAPLLLYAGRIAPEKNLSSLGTVLQRVPGTRLALVGDGPARAALERELDPERVTFTGFLRGAELAAAYASADLFVMPSRTETLGFVVLEAMASGCPVVAAGAGGIPDLVVDEANGHLFDPDRPAAAAERIRTLLADPAERKRLAEAGRQRAADSSWSAETDRLLHAYSGAMVVANQSGMWTRLRSAWTSAW